MNHSCISVENGPSSDIIQLLHCYCCFLMIVSIYLFEWLSFPTNQDFNQKIEVPAKISRFRLIAPRFTKKSAALANNRWISLVISSLGEITISSNNSRLYRKEDGIVKKNSVTVLDRRLEGQEDQDDAACSADISHLQAVSSLAASCT